MASGVCRVCLVGNSRMVNIRKNHLLEIYEKLANTKLNSERDNRMPCTVCYICHRQLQKCYSFSYIAHKSNRILQDLLQNGSEVTQITDATLSRQMHTLSVTTIQHMSINIVYSNSTSIPKTVKVEPVDDKEETVETEEIDMVQVKVEMLDEDVEIGDDLNNTELSQGDDNNVINDTNNMQSCFYCDMCKKKVSTKYQLVRHIKDCSKEFTIKNNLKKQLLVHTTGEKPSCKICDKTFNNEFHLKRHKEIHTGEKPHSCNICYRTFNQKDTLKTHMLVHTGEKLFSCRICHKAFRHKSTLTNHMLVHTAEKPYYSCNICDKKFSSKSTLKRHKKAIHTGGKPHSCNICNRTFNRKSTLKRHMLVHTVEKPHSCNICYKAFNRKSSLKTHMLMHTGENS